MSQKSPANGFEWVERLSEFDEHFIKNNDEHSDKGYFLEVDVEYPKNLFSLHRDLPFLAERKKIDKCKKLVCNIYNKENYVIHIRALKQGLTHGLILKKVHKVVQFNQKKRKKKMVKINMNTKLRTDAKNDCYFRKNNGKCKKA